MVLRKTTDLKLIFYDPESNEFSGMTNIIGQEIRDDGVHIIIACDDPETIVCSDVGCPLCKGHGKLVKWINDAPKEKLHINSDEKYIVDFYDEFGWMPDHDELLKYRKNRNALRVKKSRS